MAVLPHLKGASGALPLGEDASFRQALDAAIRSLIAPSDRLRTSGDPVPVDERSPHAVVIGSGFGGLAAAIRLGARGYRVTVLERLDRARRPRLRVPRRTGFTFDAGPTVITAPFLLEELWALCGRAPRRRRRAAPGLALLPDPLRRRTQFDYTRLGRARCAPRSARFARATSPATSASSRTSERIFEIGFEALAHVPFDGLTDMARIVPAMLAARELPHRARAGREVREGRAAAAGAQLPPAAGRRQPVSCDARSTR